MQYAIKNFVAEEIGQDLKNLRQVAAATTAVGIMADLNNESLFLKMLKPGLVLNIKRDAERIKKLVGSEPASVSIVDAILKGILEEVNLLSEAKNFELAHSVFENKGIKVPKIFERIKPNSHILAMEIAGGVNVSKLNLEDLTDEQIIKLHSAYEHSYKVWFGQSLDLAVSNEMDDDLILNILNKYDNVSQIDLDLIEDYKKIFNGDLHEGNVFIDFNPHSGKDYEITWIDWGNAHKFNIGLEQGQIKLVLASMSRNERAILDALSDIVEISDIQKKIIQEKLSSFLLSPNTAGLPSNMVTNKVMNIVLESGIELPVEMVNWSRGKGFLETTIDNINKEVIRRNIPKLKTINPSKISNDIFVNYLTKRFPLQFIGLKSNANSPLQISTLFKYIYDHFEYFLTKQCNRLFKKMPSRAPQT